MHTIMRSNAKKSPSCGSSNTNAPILILYTLILIINIYTKQKSGLMCIQIKCRGKKAIVKDASERFLAGHASPDRPRPPTTHRPEDGTRSADFERKASLCGLKHRGKEVFFFFKYNKCNHHLSKIKKLPRKTAQEKRYW
jgi:hypothetical protein